MLLALASVKLVPPVCADTRVPGVAPGQFLHYSLTHTASGNDTELIDAIIQMWQLQTWTNVTVLAVSGVNVTLQCAAYNLTTVLGNATLCLDVENGHDQIVYGNFHLPFPVLLVANLSAGDPIYTAEYAGYFLILNDTIYANYLGYQLETNHLVYSPTPNSAYGYGYPGLNSTGTVQAYWERKTGIMLEILSNIEYRREGPGGVLMTHHVARILISSAVPPIPEFPSFLILPLFIIATLPAVIVFRRKRIGIK